MALAAAATLSGTAFVASSATPTNCTPKIAWGGVESTGESNGVVLAVIPVKRRIELTNISLSISTAAKTGSLPAFAEELVLVGVSINHLYVGPREMPRMPTDPNFAPLRVSSTGPVWNDNAALQNGVVAASIIKTYGTGQSSESPVASFSQPKTIPAGGTIWIRMGEVGIPMDPEVQAVITYLPGGCK